jgi:hypothetical protein
VIYSLLALQLVSKEHLSCFRYILVLAIAIQEDATTIGAINHVLFPKQSLVLFTKRRDFRLIHFDRDGWLGKSKLWLWPTDSD